MKLFKNFHFFAFITVLFWSLAYVFTRVLVQQFSAFSLGFLRYLFTSGAFIIMLVIAGIKPPKLKDIPWFFLGGVVGLAVYIILFNTGTSMVTATTTSIVIATCPVITAVVSIPVFGEKLKPLQWLSVAIEFAGIILLTLSGGGFSVSKGVLWLLAAACFNGLYNIVVRTLTKKYDPLCVSAYCTFWATLATSVFAPKAFQELSTASTKHIVFLVILGIFSGAIAHFAWARAFQLATNTSSVSNYMFLTPLITTILSATITGELPNLITVVGGLIILIGMFVFNLGKADKTGKTLKD